MTYRSRGLCILDSQPGIFARVQANTLRSRCSLAAAAALPRIGTTFGGRISTSSKRFRRNSSATSGGTLRIHALMILSCRANSTLSRGRSAVVVGGNAFSGITRTRCNHALPGVMSSNRRYVTRHNVCPSHGADYQQELTVQHTSRMGCADGPTVRESPLPASGRPNPIHGVAQ